MNNMMSTKNKQEKPKWFKGAWYTQGDIVKNPFSGAKCLISGPELSMYDFIKGAEYTINIHARENNNYIEDPAIIKLQEEMYMGIDWFRSENPTAYMTLLD